MKTWTTNYDSPVGTLKLGANEHGLCALVFDNSAHPVKDTGWIVERQRFTEVMRQLDEYFAGRRKDFNLNLDMLGTAFQKTVWHALTQIPYGVTVSYGSLARAIGQPNACRAVGLANGRNPVAIIVPCHRVIGANGSLTGFGGGLPTKRFLLDLEQKDFALRAPSDYFTGAVA